MGDNGAEVKHAKYGYFVQPYFKVERENEQNEGYESSVESLCNSYDVENLMLSSFEFKRAFETDMQTKINLLLMSKSDAGLSLMLFPDQDKQKLTLQAVGDRVLPRPAVFNIANANDALYKAIKEGDSLKTSDLSLEAKLFLTQHTKLYVKSFLAIPISTPINPEKTFLLLCLLNKKGAAPSPKAEKSASSLTSASSNSKPTLPEFDEADFKYVISLFGHLSRNIVLTISKKAESMRLSKFKRLAQILQSIYADGKTFKEKVKTLLSKSRSLLEAQACCWFTLDQSRQLLILDAANGVESPEPEQNLVVDIAPTHGHVKNGTLRNIREEGMDPAFYNRMQESFNLKVYCCLSVPIQKNNETFALIEFYNKNNHKYFDHFDENIARAIAEMYSIVIH